MLVSTAEIPTPSSNTTYIIGTIVMFVWNGLISYWLFILARNDRRHEMSRKTIEELTAKIVDERFTRFSERVAGEVNAFSETLKHLRVVMEKQEAELDSMWDGERAMEQKIAEKLHDLRIETLREFSNRLGDLATRKDLDRLREEIRKSS